MRFKALNRLIILGILLSSIQLSYGQGYQRLFDSDTRDIYASCSSQAESGGVYLVNSYSIVSNPDSTGVSVSKHDEKGTLIWSMEYYAEDVTYFTQDKSIECRTMGGDTLAVVVVDMEFAATSDDKILYIIDPNGGLLSYSKIIDIDEEFEDAEPNIFTELLVDNAGLNYFGTHNFMDTIAVHHEQIVNLDQTVLSNSYYGIDADTLPVGLQFFDAKTTRDSGYVFTAALEQEDEAAAVVKINEIGQVELANVYSTRDIPDGQLQFRSIVEVSDSSYVALGYARSMGNAANDNFVVVRLDTIGNIMWYKNIKALDLGVSTTLVDFKEVMQTPTGEIIIAGKYTDVVTQESGEVAVFFDVMGNEIRQTSYTSPASVWQEPTDIFNALDIHNTTDGSILMTASGQADSGRYGIMVVKMDTEGLTLCNQIPALTVGSDTLVVRDTFAIAQSRFVQRTEMDTVTVNRFEYQVPVVVLQDTVYCPNDSINYLLDATVDVGDSTLVSYMWETGDTTPTYTALDSGDYMVTVTVFKEECFTICAPVNVSRSELPIAMMSNVYICDGDIRDLTVSNTQGAISEAIWSNGETTTTITIDDNPSDLYSVTITDMCGDTATIDYTVPIRTDIATPADPILQCGLEPGLEGRLELFGDIEFEIEEDDPIIHTPFTYLWDTGSTDRSIIVDAPAPGGFVAHIVTVTDACGNEGTIEFNYDYDDFLLEEPTAAIAEPTFENCMFSLAASGTPSLTQGGSIVSFSWTGPNGFTSDQSDILVVAPGTYTVVVTDDCGNTATASAEIAEPVLDVTIVNNGLNSNCTAIGLVASSQNQGLGGVTYVWNTNATGALLEVGETANASETYTVTATDCDGNMATANVTVALDEFTPPPIEVEIIEESGEECQRILTANISGAAAGSSLLWSTGESTPSIIVEENGSVSVTVTSVCDIVAMAEIEDLVVADLEFPNIFFPVNNLEEENDSFGPFVDCDLDIAEYTLEIYNRWGKRVFEADNIQERWRGTLNNAGNFLEEDVYMWQCFYTNAAGEQSQKGSVSLVRK